MKTLNLHAWRMVLTALFIPVFAHAELLKLKVKQGDQYKTHAQISVSTNISIADSTTTSMSLETGIDNVFRIREVKVKECAVDMALTRLQMSLSAPKKAGSITDFTLDTDDVMLSDSLLVSPDQANRMKQMGVMMKLITDQIIPINIATNGKIQKAETTNEAMTSALAYLDRYVSRLPISADSISKIKTEQRKKLKQTNLSAGYEKSFITFPDNEINQGDSWQVIVPMSNNDTINKLILTYTLAKITPDEYLIELSSGKTASSPSNNPFAGLFKMTLGDYKATYHLDKATCLIKNAEGAVTISMSIGDDANKNTSISSPNKKSSGGMKMSITTNFKISGEVGKKQ